MRYIMSNFDFLTTESQFDSFSGTAVTAEKIFSIDYSSCVINCRRAMEFAVKWMYSVDSALVQPWDDNLLSLMSTTEFQGIVDASLLTRMHYIRKTGNTAAHAGCNITHDQAMLCLENLWYFMDFIAYCYANSYTQGSFDPAIVEAPQPGPAPEPVIMIPPETEKKLEDLIRENEALKEELTARREQQEQTYTPKPLDISEFKTRKLYIDAILTDAGWTEGKNWINEYEIQGMPNKSETGFADYALLGDDGKVLAVIEAKRTCVDVSKGRQQAKLYADQIEQKQGLRPVVFLTNGFETRIIDNQYSERKVAAIWSKRDLEKWFNLQRMRSSLRTKKTQKQDANTTRNSRKADKAQTKRTWFKAMSFLLCSFFLRSVVHLEIRPSDPALYYIAEPVFGMSDYDVGTVFERLFRELKFRLGPACTYAR